MLKNVVKAVPLKGFTEHCPLVGKTLGTRNFSKLIYIFSVLLLNGPK